MNNWNQLLVTLDKTIGFPNKISSNVKKRWQGYDLWKNEHVIWLEYRVKVNPGIHAPQDPPQHRRDVHRDPVSEAESMAMIRELLEMRFENRGGSPHRHYHPLERQAGNGKIGLTAKVSSIRH